MKTFLRRDDDEGRHEGSDVHSPAVGREEAKVNQRGQGVGVYLGKSG